MNKKIVRGPTIHVMLGGKWLDTTNKNERRGKILDYDHQVLYKVIKVKSNGTVKMELNNFEEPINIHTLDPYFGKTVKLA